MSSTPVAAAASRPAGFLRAIIGGLTTRGRSFVAGGLAASVCAFLLGQRDLLRVGVLLIALPVVAAVAIGRSHYRLSLHRTITPSRVVAGSVAKVRLEIEHLSRGLTRVLLAEDRVPYGLGPSPRFVISRLPGGRRAAVTYSLRTIVRGRYEIGPLHLTLSDPFGLCEVTRSFTATDPMTVLPQVWPINGLPPGGQWSGNGESAHGTAAASGEHDVAIREYRHGDDLRRVHWRSSARRGELMVRRDEQPRERRATILLDSRLHAHAGEGPSASFEWAVCAAASVAVSLSEQRYAVRLLTDGQPTPWTAPRGTSGAAALLDRLATTTLLDEEALSRAITTLDRSSGDGLVVAVLGSVTPESAAALSRTRRNGTSAVALVLRTWQWDSAHDSQSSRNERAVALLRAAGWLVTEVSPAEAIPAVWQRAISAGPSGQVLRGGAPTLSTARTAP